MKLAVSEITIALFCEWIVTGNLYWSIFFKIVFAAVLAVSAAQFKGFGNPPRAVPRPSPPPRPAASRVASSDQAANVLRYDSDISPDGSFNYA